MSRRTAWLAPALLLSTSSAALVTTSCFPLERTASLEAGSVLGSATRPDIDGSPGAGFVKITGVGSSVVRSGDADGAFKVAGLGPGRLDLRFVDDVDGDGWADRGRDISVFIAADSSDESLGTVDVGTLPLAGSFGLRGTSTPPAIVDDSQVVRLYALRGRCAVDVGEGSGSDITPGDCESAADVLPRLEHGVEAEVAADATGAWLMTRLVAGRVDVVAVLHERNADGSLGAVVDVVGPFAVDGTATDANAPPRDAGLTIDFDDVPPPVVRVQLVLSRAVDAADAFAVLTPPGAVVPACTSDDVRATAEAIAGAVVVDAAAASFSASVPAGAWNVVVCDGARRGASSSLVAVPAADEAVPALWPIVMLDVDRCPLDPTDPGDADRDCDDDGVRGLPLATIDALRASCAAQCFPDATAPFESLGAALGGRTCAVDGETFDCDDDADGQPDVTEPGACIGAGRGTDLDGDGLCSVVDSYPHCAANTAAACPVGDEDITPQVQGGGASGIGLLRGPVGTQITVSSGSDSVDVTIDVGADEAGVTLLYGEVAFTPPSSDPAALSIVAGGIDGLVCGIVSRSPIIVGCEHGHDLVSRDGDSVSLFGDGAEVVIGGLPADDSEGRYIAFQSGSSLLPGANGDKQIYWHDRGTGVTLLVSAGEGIAGNGRSEQPAISADGLSVVFTSLATNLVAADTNRASDVFLWRVSDPDVVERVSVAEDGTEGDGSAAAASIDADGDVVAFTSSSSTLTAGVSGINTVNVFRKSLVSGAVTLLSVRLADAAGIGGQNPAISHDGNRVAFWSFTAGVVENDNNGLWDVYLYEASSSSTKRVSLRADGGERNQGNDSTSGVAGVAISGDGRFVAWTSSSTDVVTDDDNGPDRDVFVTTVDTGAVIRASAGSDSDSPALSDERVSLSADGRFIAFASTSTTTGAVVLRELPAGVPQTIVASGAVGVPSISATGAYVVVAAGSALDPRSPSTGSFAVFTGRGASWWAGR